MFTDMVGFTALTQRDEARALRVLEQHNQILRPLFGRFRGSEVKSIGDSFLVEFESALEAVNCALELQRAIARFNSDVSDNAQFHVRIGIHLGDVVHTDGDVFGDAVNIASRIEPLADPDGICVSEPVASQVRDKLDATFERLERPELKNVEATIGVYRVVPRRDGRSVDLRGAEVSTVRRLAVLPFSNLSPDPEDEFFADGLTEELISELARIPDCQVIARTSVMRYKSAPKGIKEVGRDLGVEVALEGSVRKSAGRIRVTAQLIDVRSEAHLWSERYDRDFGEIFDLQSEIAARVAGALKIQLDPRERGATRPPTRNTEAFENYLKGRQHWWQSGEQGYRTAIRYFEKAIEVDPAFALAYCGLADSHALLGNHGYVPMAEALDRAEAAARRALAIDSTLADGYISLAPVLYNRYDWTGAEDLLRRAILLDPNNVLGHYWLAVAAGGRGKLEDALEHSRIAASLDPLARQTALSPAVYLYALHRYAEALQYLADAEARVGYRSDYYLALCELGLGHVDSALEHFRRAASGEFQTWPARRTGLAIGLARAGRTEEFQRHLDRLTEDAEAHRIPSGCVAKVHAAVGEKDSAFEWFDRAYEERSALVVEDLVSDPLLDGLRTDPRFEALLRKFRYID